MPIVFRAGHKIWPVFRNPEQPKVIWCGQWSNLRTDVVIKESFNLETETTPNMARKFSRFIDMNRQAPTHRQFRLYMLEHPIPVGPKQVAIGFVTR